MTLNMLRANKVSRFSHILVIFCSLLVAQLLELCPIYNAAHSIDLPFVVLVVIFWCLSTPGLTIMTLSFIWGLLLDVLLGTSLGVHGLGLIVVAYCAIINHRLLLIVDKWRQLISVIFLVICYKIILYLAQMLLATAPLGWSYWLAILATVMIWPGLALLLPLKSKVMVMED